MPDGGDLPGVPLLLNKASKADFRLEWAESCLNHDADYAVYEGLLGDFTSQLPVTRPFCTTLGATSVTQARRRSREGD